MVGASPAANKMGLRERLALMKPWYVLKSEVDVGSAVETDGSTEEFYARLISKHHKAEYMPSVLHLSGCENADTQPDWYCHGGGHKAEYMPSVLQTKARGERDPTLFK